MEKWKTPFFLLVFCPLSHRRWDFFPGRQVADSLPIDCVYHLFFFTFLSFPLRFKSVVDKQTVGPPPEIESTSLYRKLCRHTLDEVLEHRLFRLTPPNSPFLPRPPIFTLAKALNTRLPELHFPFRSVLFFSSGRVFPTPDLVFGCNLRSCPLLN